jgi:hypothetical protein
MKALLLALAAVIATATASAARAQDQLLDEFAEPAAWTLSASDDVKAELRPALGPHGSALCIDFDFGNVTGYVSARRAVPIDYPARFEFLLNVRGDAPPNTLQLKLVDASGDNVWWANRPDYRFAHDWQAERFRQRDIAFAWGPAADRRLRQTASVELVIASGSGAGRGSTCFDRLVLRRLPDELSPDEARDFDAVTVRWRPGASPSRYDLQFSDDGSTWRTVRHIEGARGDVQQHLFVAASAPCASWPTRSQRPSSLAWPRMRARSSRRSPVDRAEARTRAPTSASSRTGPSSASTADAWLRC